MCYNVVMKNICATIEYFGTNYCGFQLQKNGNSVCNELINAIFCATQEKVTITASGRTDAGVHALGQVINFELDKSLPIAKFPIIINRYLPIDIKLIECHEVPASFNARKSAKKKTYKYLINNSDRQGIVEENRELFFPYQLDIDKMRSAAKILVGEHNFRAFMSSGSQVKDTVRTIYDINIEKEGCHISIEVTGNGFLYNMVRIIVGTLLDVGTGHKSADTINQMLATYDRSLGGKTAPSHGLYLERVEYI